MHAFRAGIGAYSLPSKYFEGDVFADFAVLGAINENFIFEIFRPPYSVCKSAKFLFLATLFSLEIFRLQ